MMMMMIIIIIIIIIIIATVRFYHLYDFKICPLRQRFCHDQQGHDKRVASDDKSLTL